MVEVWYGGKKVEDLPRVRGRSKHRIDYRHVIDWLVRKPGAFENYRYREDLFPTSRFRMVWDALREHSPLRCNRHYLEILQVAAQEGEARVDDVLRYLLEEGELEEGKLNAKAVGELLDREARLPAATEVAVTPVDLASFDVLLSASVESGVSQ